MSDKDTVSVAEINSAIKIALRKEFNVDVGFKNVSIDDALNYITQTVVQRVKQRLNSKSQRDQYKTLKEKHPQLFKDLQKK